MKDDEKTQSAVVVVLHPGTLDNARLLLAVTNRHHGGFGLPGGKVEADEEPRAAACRELLEETGLVAKQSSLALLLTGKSVTNSRRTVFVYHCSQASGVPVAKEEGTEIRWTTLKRLCRDSHFAQFYQTHFPDGLYHLRTTRLPEVDK